MSVITGPSTANIAPPNPAPMPVAQVVVYYIHFDMVAHTYSIEYGNAAGTVMRRKTGPMPAPMQTSLLAHIQAGIEADQGWAAASSTVVTP